MAFAAYLAENAILVLSWVGQLLYNYCTIIVPYFKPHRGAFAAFPKQKGQMPGGGGGACFELTEPLNMGSTEVL